MSRIAVAALACLLMLQPAAAQDQPANVATELANAYGLDRWNEIDEIRFTFTVDRDNGQMKRAWAWQPKTGQVTRTVDGESLAFNEKQITDQSPEQQRRAHHQFINDSYWFLMPFQTVWSQPELTVLEDAASPVQDDPATYIKLTTSYPSGGYTPGDAYDLYLDRSADARPNPKLVYWVFRRGGKPGGGATMWENQQQLGPIVVALDRRRPGAETAHLYFTDVSARLIDGREFTPEPIPRESENVESR